MVSHTHRQQDGWHLRNNTSLYMHTRTHPHTHIHTHTSKKPQTDKFHPYIHSANVLLVPTVCQPSLGARRTAVSKYKMHAVVQLPFQ